MNTWRSCLALGTLFYAVAKAFDALIPLRPIGLFWDMSYYGIAATCDWFLYRISPRFVGGKILRDVQALSLAFIVTNAFGFARYMAYSPPSIYNWIIQGINYVLAIRLISTGYGDAIDNIDWRGVVRCVAIRRAGFLAQEAQK